MIADDIRNYAKQFEYEPFIENAAKLKSKKFKKFIVAGMGGSHLAANLLKAWHPELDIVIWPNYGLPPLHEKELKERLIIVSSYSGNTEEAIDAFNAARAKHFTVAVIVAGGKLLRLAQKFKTPYVAMPDFHFQPRMALGLGLRALLAVMNEKTMLAETGELAKQIHPSREELHGKELAKRLHGSVPVIYASSRNASAAANWKIRFNETGKIPAFWNVLPEMNHNEMTGFDVKTRTLPLSRNFHFVFLKDGEDDRRLLKRMAVLERLFRERGLPSEVVILQGKTRLQKLFMSLVLADWTAYYTARMYDIEPEQVPMVEEFKKLVR
jgi:glucose/mannose-6-phosphate isomerase